MKTVLHYLRPRLGIMSVGLLIKFFRHRCRASFAVDALCYFG